MQVVAQYLSNLGWSARSFQYVFQGKLEQINQKSVLVENSICTLLQNGDWERIFSTWERQAVIYVGAAVMYMIGKRLKKRHNILDDARQSLYNEVNFFLKAIENKGTQFIGGAEPNLADLAIYGCISSIDGNLSVGEFDKPQHHLINIFF